MAADETAAPEEDEEEDDEEFDEHATAASADAIGEVSLPPTSNDIPFPRYLIMSSLAVYETLRHFSSVLRLACFHYEEFVAALSATNENTSILAETHICLLRALLRSEDASQVMLCYADQNACLTFYQYLLLSHSTWPCLFHMYAKALPNGQLSYVSASYPLASADMRLRVLRDLCDLFVQCNAVREEMLKEDVRLRYEDHCRVCGKVGDLLCCESCPAVYHLGCLDPPITEVPEDDWQCPVCVRTSLSGVTDCRDPQELAPLHYSHRRRVLGRDRSGRLYWFAVRRLFVEDPETDDLVYFSNAEQLEGVAAALSPSLEKRLLSRMAACRDSMARQMRLMGGEAAGRELGGASYRKYTNAYSADERALSKQQLAEEENKKRHLSYKVCLDAFRWITKQQEVGSEHDIIAALRDGLLRFADELPAAFLCPSWANLRPAWLRELQRHSENGDEDKRLSVKRLAQLLAQFALCIRWVCFASFWTDGAGLTDMIYITPLDKEKHKRGRKAEREAAAANAAAASSFWSDLVAPTVPTKNRKPIRHSVYRQAGEEFRLRAGDGWMWISRARHFSPAPPPAKRTNAGCSLDQMLGRREALISSYAIQIPALERRLEAMQEELNSLTSTLALRKENQQQLQQQQQVQQQQIQQQHQLVTNGGRQVRPVPQYDGGGGVGYSSDDNDEFDEEDGEDEEEYYYGSDAGAAAFAMPPAAQPQHPLVTRLGGATAGPAIVKVPLVLGASGVPAATNLVVKRLPTGVAVGPVAFASNSLSTVVRIAPPIPPQTVIRPTPLATSASSLIRVVAPTKMSAAAASAGVVGVRPASTAVAAVHGDAVNFRFQGGSSAGRGRGSGGGRFQVNDDEDSDDDGYSMDRRPRGRGGRGRGGRGRGRSSQQRPTSPPPQTTLAYDYDPASGFSARRSVGPVGLQQLRQHQQHFQTAQPLPAPVPLQQHRGAYRSPAAPAAGIGRGFEATPMSAALTPLPIAGGVKATPIGVSGSGRRSAVMSVPNGPVRVRATPTLVNAAIEHRCREIRLAMDRCRRILTCLAGEDRGTSQQAYQVSSVSVSTPENYNCPKPPPSRRVATGIFNQPRVHLAILARRAGRWELPGFSYERKPPTLCRWPYPSPRPSVCAAWLHMLLSEPTVFTVAFAMRMLHHCLAWDEIYSECPGANQENGEYAVPQQTGPGDAAKEKKQVTRVVRAHQQLDSCGLTYRYLVEKTIVTSVPAVGRYAAALSDDYLDDEEGGGLESGDDDWMPGLGGGRSSGKSGRRRNRGGRGGAAAYRETRSQVQEEWMREKDLHLWEVLYYQSRMIKALKNLRDNEKLRELAMPKTLAPPPPQPQSQPPPQPPQPLQQLVQPADQPALPSPALQPPRILSVSFGPPRITAVSSVSSGGGDVGSTGGGNLIGSAASTGGGNPITARIAAAAAASGRISAAAAGVSALRKQVFARRTEDDLDAPPDPKAQQQLEALRRAMAATVGARPSSERGGGIAADEEEDSFDLAERKRPPPQIQKLPLPLQPRQHLVQQHQQPLKPPPPTQQPQLLKMKPVAASSSAAAVADRGDRLLKALANRAAQLKAAMLKRRQLASQEMRLELEQEREEAKRLPPNKKPSLSPQKPSAVEQPKKQFQQKSSLVSPPSIQATSSNINLDDVFASVFENDSTGGASVSDDSDQAAKKLQKVAPQKSKRTPPASSQQQQEQRTPLSPKTPRAKGRKRQRSGSSTASAGTKRQLLSASAATTETPKAAAAGVSSDEPLYCLCRQPYDPAQFYIGCDRCDDWYHGRCIGLTETEANKLDGYLCQACRDKDKGATAAASKPTPSSPVKSAAGKGKKRRAVSGSSNADDVYCLCRTPYDATRVYLACDVCDDWFHVECVGLSEAKAKALASYTCARCRDSGHAKSNHQVVINSRVHGELLDLIRRVCDHPTAAIFLKPVDTRRYRDYLALVTEPMDLSTVRQKLVKKRYKTLGNFISDVELIFSNSRLYNPIVSQEFQDTKELESFFTAELKTLKDQLK